MTEEVKAEDARREFAELLNGVQWRGAHVAVTRHGRRSAVLVPPDWYERAVAAMGGGDATQAP